MSLYDSNSNLNNLMQLRDNMNNKMESPTQFLNFNKLTSSKTEKLRTIFKSKLETNCKEFTIPKKSNLVPDNSNSIDLNPSMLSNCDDVDEKQELSDRRTKSNRDHRIIKLSKLEESNS